MIQTTTFTIASTLHQFARQLAQLNTTIAASANSTVLSLALATTTTLRLQAQTLEQQVRAVNAPVKALLAQEFINTTPLANSLAPLASTLTALFTANLTTTTARAQSQRRGGVSPLRVTSLSRLTSATQAACFRLCCCSCCCTSPPSSPRLGASSSSTLRCLCCLALSMAPATRVQQQWQQVWPAAAWTMGSCHCLPLQQRLLTPPPDDLHLMPQKLIELAHSMPARGEAVIAANGWHTKY